MEPTDIPKEPKMLKGIESVEKGCEGSDQIPAESEDEELPEFLYADGLWRKPSSHEERIPWFLHSLVKPPADPLTIRLLALVEDLPSMAGPKTVGSENYSRIFDSFLRRGWEGFEEEFDRIVPRDRPDYADVKRDLLREPLFSMKAHRNMVESLLGRKTIDEIFDEMARESERKPQ